MSMGGLRTTVPPFPVFRWTNSADEKRLLELVRKDDEFVYAFCARTVTKPPRQHAIAQRLCLEFVASDRYFHTYAKKTGMVEQIDGIWRATDKWTTKITNPVRTKLRSLMESYNKAQEKYARFIKPDYTKFADVHSTVRGDLLVACPHFFLIKELRDPIEPARIPRVGTPAPGPARQVRRKIEIPNRSITRSPPSPSPSRGSRSQRSPEAEGQPQRQSSNIGLARAGPFALPSTAAPRAVPGQSEVASSSRIPIKVESVSSSSSSHSISDDNSDELSEHEMDNDSVKEDSPVSASPEKRDWLNLRSASTSRADHQAKFRPGADVQRHLDRDSESGLGNSSPKPKPEHVMTLSSQRYLAVDSSSRQGSAIRQHGNANGLSTQLPTFRGTDASEDEDDEERGPVIGEGIDSTVIGHVEVMDTSSEHDLKRNAVWRIRKRLRSAVDDSTMAHDVETPRAIFAFSGFYSRYTGATTNDERDKLVYQAQLRLLCQAMLGMETNLAIPKSLRGCLIYFDPALHPGPHERVAQLVHFAHLAGAIVCQRRAALYSKSTYARRILVSFRRLGFDRKTSRVKRGASTYTICHYSLLAFGQFCSIQLGDISEIPFL